MIWIDGAPLELTPDQQRRAAVLAAVLVCAPEVLDRVEEALRAGDDPQHSEDRPGLVRRE